MNLMPPHSMEAERALLGAVLTDNSILFDMDLSPEEFYRDAHRRIYGKMLDLHEDGKPIDIVVLPEELGGDLGKVGGAVYISQLVDDTITAANARYHAEIIREKALRRQIMQRCHETLKGIETGDVEGLVTNLQVEYRPGGSGAKSIKEVVKAVLAAVEKRHETPDSISGIPTGFKELDNLTDGIQSEYYVLAARPSMGKTALAWALAKNTAENGRHPHIVDVESDNESMVIRALAEEADVPIWKLKKGGLRGFDDWRQVMAAAGTLSGLGITMDDTAFSSRAVRYSILQAHKKGADVIFVDYIQLIEGDKGKKREREIAEISIMLKNLRKQLRIPIIALAQLSRDVERRENKRPVLADLRETGQLEQDADVVLFLYRDFYYSKKISKKHEAEVIVAKGRNMGRGTVTLYFDELRTQFKDWRPESK